MEKLKPCPFCGSSAIVTRTFEYPSEPLRFGCQAICSDCGARLESNMGYVKLYSSPDKAEESAVKHWNTRVERTCNVESRVVEDDTGALGYFCSECGYEDDPQEWSEMFKYCPNCGAKVVDKAKTNICSRML